MNENTLKFDVHASLLFQLGEQLIADEITAVSELIKNSYDADANFVKVYVDPEYSGELSEGRVFNGKIEINDNGNGMDIKKIKKGWLTISRSEKREMKEKNELTSKHNRVPLGDKGLGRLSAQRLGNYFKVVTKQEGSLEELTVDIDWSLFRKDVTLSQVDIPLETKIVSKEHKKKSYTKLTIYDLKNISDWKTNKYIDEFEKSIAKIISPFDINNIDINKKGINKKFIIKAQVGQRKLEFPEIQTQMLRSAPASYELTINHNCIEINGSYRLEYFDTSIKDRLHEFVELNNKKLEESNIIYFNEGIFVFKFTKRIDLQDIGDYMADNHPGNFKGELYDFSLDSKIFKGLSDVGLYRNYERLTDFRSYIKENAGVKIYRDDFRIFPYGELESSMGFDWLALSRSSTSGRYTDLKPINLVGFIKLTGINNKKLKELTSREGFIDDKYSRTFVEICRFAIKEINDNRTFLRSLYDSYKKQLKLTDEAKSNHIPTYVDAKNQLVEAAEEADRLSKHANESKNQVMEIQQSMNKSKEEISLIKTITPEQKEKINDIINQLQNRMIQVEQIFLKVINSFSSIQNIRAASISLVEQIEISLTQVEEVMQLAGLGITAESLTHELYTLINNTKFDAQGGLKYFKKEYEADINLESYFDSIITRVESLRKQVTHLSPGFKNVRTKKEKINIGKMIENHFEFYRKRAERSGITLINIKPRNTFDIYANKGTVVQVLDNLFSNAEYWLKHSYNNKLIKDMEYYIEITPSGFIYVWDSGIGISRNIEDRIFEPFITSRMEGRGLGLYIITRILLNQGCSIRLMEPRNKFENKYKIEIDFTKVLIEG